MPGLPWQAEEIARLPFPNTRRAAYAVRVSADRAAIFTARKALWTENRDPRR
jgi:hypothetical protein